MSKRASHWPRKRQYWAAQRARRRLDHLIDITVGGLGLFRRVMVRSSPISIERDLDGWRYVCIGPESVPVDLLVPDVDSERSSFKAWAKAVDRLVAETCDGGDPDEL